MRVSALRGVSAARRCGYVVSAVMLMLCAAAVSAAAHAQPAVAHRHAHVDALSALLDALDAPDGPLAAVSPSAHTALPSVCEYATPDHIDALIDALPAFVAGGSVVDVSLSAGCGAGGSCSADYGPGAPAAAAEGQGGGGGGGRGSQGADRSSGRRQPPRARQGSVSASVAYPLDARRLLHVLHCHKHIIDRLYDADTRVEAAVKAFNSTSDDRNALQTQLQVCPPSFSFRFFFFVFFSLN